MLKVEHVSYRYPNGERDVLQDVCCTLEDGQLSAIVAKLFAQAGLPDKAKRPDAPPPATVPPASRAKPEPKA